MTENSMMILLLFLAVHGMDLSKTPFGNPYDQRYANNALVRVNRNSRPQNRQLALQQFSDDRLGTNSNSDESPRIRRIPDRYEVLEESVTDNRKVRRTIRDNETGEVFQDEQDFERFCQNDYSNRTQNITYKFGQPFRSMKNAMVEYVAKPLGLECEKAKPKCKHGTCKYPEKDDGEKGYKLIKLGSACKQHEGYLHRCCFFKYDHINHFGVCHAQEGTWSYVKECFKSQAFLNSHCKEVNQYAELTASNRFWVHVYHGKKIIYFVATVLLISLYIFNMWAHWGSGWLTPADYKNWEPFTEHKWTVVVDTIASITTFFALPIHMFMNGMIVNFMNIIPEKVMNIAGYATVLGTLLNFIPGQVGTIIQAVIYICFAFYAWWKGVTFMKIFVQFMYFAWVISTLMTSFPTLGVAFKDQSGEWL